MMGFAFDFRPRLNQKEKHFKTPNVVSAYSLFEKFLAQCNRDYRENFKMFMASSKIVEIPSQSFVEIGNLKQNRKGSS